MPEAPASNPAARSASLAPIWVALVLAVIVIVALSLNTAQVSTEIDRMSATGVYPTELTLWTRWRFSLARFWGQFWWLLGPFILCAFPGAAALYRLVRYDSAR